MLKVRKSNSEQLASRRCGSRFFFVSLNMIVLISAFLVSCKNRFQDNTSIDSTGSDDAYALALRDAEIIAYATRFSEEIRSERADAARFSIALRNAIDEHYRLYKRIFDHRATNTEGEVKQLHMSLRQKPDGALWFAQGETASLDPTTSKTVFRVTRPSGANNGTSHFFRSFDSAPEAARKTIAAAMINKALQLNTVPQATVQKFWCESKQGKKEKTLCLGVISDQANGEQPHANFSNLDHFLAQYVDPLESNNSQNFEFLVGNTDVHGANVFVAPGPSKSIMVVDHGDAFPDALPTSSRAFGAMPFGKPTDTLCSGLSTPVTKLEPEISRFLTARELEVLEYRRLVLVQACDSRSQGNQ
jgi:hypothetical protein